MHLYFLMACHAKMTALCSLSASKALILFSRLVWDGFFCLGLVFIGCCGLLKDKFKGQGAEFLLLPGPSG